MNKIILFITFITFSIFVNAQIQNYSLNEIIDDFTVTDTNGVEHNLYTYTSQGKYVFLDFFFDTCPPCIATSPIFNEYHELKGSNQQDVICLTINNGTDTNAEVIAFEDAYGGDFDHAPAVGIEGGCAAVDNNLNPVAYPTYCLISPENRIVTLDIWPIASTDTFEDALQAAQSAASLNDNTNLNFSIFPNPSNNGNISIKLNEFYNNINVSIVNVIGKKVFSNDFASSEINLNQNLTSGIYLVTLKSDNAVYTKKLVVR